MLNGDFKVTYDVNRDQLCDLLVSLKLPALRLRDQAGALVTRASLVPSCSRLPTTILPTSLLPKT